MPSHLSGRTRPTKVKRHQSSLKRKRDDVDVVKLQQAVDEHVLNELVADFEDLPLSDATKEGLKASHFTTLTRIQQRAVPFALKGHDILGAAKTGSGKTLAFIVPVLENLYRAQCVGADAGLGALIITPIRELAMQIFEVLRQVGGKGHLFSAGLITGGKKGMSLRDEQDMLPKLNIAIGTPGRILQHLSETPGFSFAVDNLKMLVLDEADRIMDSNFQSAMDAIIEYMPPTRQTLLFSATQTKKVSDLSRLSLRNPEYISVDHDAASATPQTLQQNYIISPLHEKLDTLYSFLQTAKKSKILIFLSSAKQVRFVYESFRQLRPGIPLLHLHGRQKQGARMEITQRFAAANTSCLFATDVVARGIDFPAVDWVVQVDCPEDADTYIHRVGRTARFNRNGRAVLFLDPTEEAGMLARLEAKKVPIEKINVKQKKQQTIKNQLQNMCFKDPQLKYLGQRAFTSYAKSIWLQHDKEIFDLKKLPLQEFAASLGLPGAPRVKFLGTAQNQDKQKMLKNAPRRGMSPEETDDETASDEEAHARKKAKTTTIRTKYDRMFERQNQDILTDHYTKLIHSETNGKSAGRSEDGSDASEDEEIGFLSVKRRIPAEPAVADDNDSESGSTDLNHGQRVVRLPGAAKPLIIDSKRREKLLKSKKKLLQFKDLGKRTVFDEQGNPHDVYEFEDESNFKVNGAEVRNTFLEKEKARVAEEDVLDKMEAKRKKKEKLRKRREREKAEEVLDTAGNELPTVGMADGGRDDLFANFVADADGLEEMENMARDILG